MNKLEQFNKIRIEHKTIKSTCEAMGITERLGYNLNQVAKIPEKTRLDFADLYNNGLTIEQACKKINLPAWLGYCLKEAIGLHQEQWQRMGLPLRFSEKTIAILYGTLLGDGSIHHSGNCKYYKFCVTHCSKQLSYLEWLKKELAELKPSDIHLSGDAWGSHRFSTPPHPHFDNMHNIFYSSGKKQITSDILSCLTPLSLAIWYMDDGGTQQKAYGCKIATCAFSISECKLICDYLKAKWDIESEVRNYDYPRIFFKSRGANKLRDLIEAYVIPSMRYKLQWD